jgi:hypothetical protein
MRTFRRRQIHGGKVQVHVGLPRFQYQFGARVPSCFINLDVFHKDRGLVTFLELSSQIQHGQPLECSHPELAVRSDGDIGLARGALPGVQPVNAAVGGVIERRIRIQFGASEVTRGNPVDAASSAHPKVMLMGLDHARRLQRAVHPNQPIVFDAADAAHRRKHVEVAEGVFLEWTVRNVSLPRRCPNRHKVVTHQVIDTGIGRCPDASMAILEHGNDSVAGEPVRPGVIVEMLILHVA